MGNKDLQYFITQSLQGIGWNHKFKKVFGVVTSHFRISMALNSWSLPLGWPGNLHWSTDWTELRIA